MSELFEIHRMKTSYLSYPSIFLYLPCIWYMYVAPYFSLLLFFNLGLQFGFLHPAVLCPS